jgi:hypothetical protein
VVQSGASKQEFHGPRRARASIDDHDNDSHIAGNRQGKGTGNAGANCGHADSAVPAHHRKNCPLPVDRDGRCDPRVSGRNIVVRSAGQRRGWTLACAIAHFSHDDPRAGAFHLHDLAYAAASDDDRHFLFYDADDLLLRFCVSDRKHAENHPVRFIRDAASILLHHRSRDLSERSAFRYPLAASRGDGRIRGRDPLTQRHAVSEKDRIGCQMAEKPIYSKDLLRRNALLGAM